MKIDPELAQAIETTIASLTEKKLQAEANVIMWARRDVNALVEEINGANRKLKKIKDILENPKAHPTPLSDIYKVFS